MEYTNLRKLGLYVSRLCFGAMAFGSDIATASEAQKIVDMAIDAGINFFHTANVYNDGSSERGVFDQKSIEKGIQSVIGNKKNNILT